MPVSHYTDAGHLEMSSEDSSDTIEMASMEDLAITPDPRHHKHEDFPHPHHDSDEDSEDDDEGDRALLSPRDRLPVGEDDAYLVENASVWVQARRIVIEVFLRLLRRTRMH